MSLHASADDAFHANRAKDVDEFSSNSCAPTTLSPSSSAVATLVQVEETRLRCSRCACELLAHPNAIVVSATGDQLTPRSAGLSLLFVAANETERKTVAWCDHANDIVLLASEIALLVKNVRNLHCAAGVASVHALRTRADDLALKPSSMQNGKLARFEDHLHHGHTADVSVLFKIAEFEKPLSLRELQSLLNGDSIRASFVDCYFRYLVEYEHVTNVPTPRIYCLSTSNTDQIRSDPKWIIDMMRRDLDRNALVDTSLILVPIALAGHVTLAAITFSEYSLKMRTTYYDSLGDEPPLALLEDLNRIVATVFGAVPLKISTGKMTKQRGPDCGLHTMFQGRELVRCARTNGYTMQKASKDMSSFRAEVHQKLKSHCS
jgi:hypothetical protein